MNLSRLCLGLGALATSLSAQVTSPAGYLSTEGATNHAYILGNRLNLTWQQIDSTHRGNTWLANSIAWRRDGTSAVNADATARTMEVEIFMANSDLLGITTTHTANYVGQPTNVVKKKTVSAPDWTAQPASAPAPFNFNVPYDTPWVYTGEHDLLWEVRVTKNSYSGTAFSNYPFDFQYINSGGSFTNGPNPSANTNLGKGCAVTSAGAFTYGASLDNYGTKFGFNQKVANGPANTPVTAFLGVTNPNVQLPGWCTTLHTDALVPIPVGTTDAAGAASMSLNNIPHAPAAVGGKFYFQAIAPSSRGLALTNGVEVVPAADPNVPRVGRVYTYDLSSGSQTKSGPWTGGIIVRFQ